MGSLDSLYLRNSSQWAQYYNVLQNNLGPTATLLNFGNQRTAGLVTATTFTGRRFHDSGLAPTWTPSEALSAWDTAFDLKLPTNWLGYAPILTFNGSDESATAPDATYWSRGDSNQDFPFSVGGWFNVTDTATTRTLIAKWDDTGAGVRREWRLEYSSTDLIRLISRDESAAVNSTRASDAAGPQGRVALIIGTYNGAGGASASDGSAIYVDAAVVASTATNNASYVAMENAAGVVSIGAQDISGTDANFFSGQMLGGPWSPFFTQIALTAAQVKNLFEEMRLGLGI